MKIGYFVLVFLIILDRTNSSIKLVSDIDGSEQPTKKESNKNSERKLMKKPGKKQQKVSKPIQRKLAKKRPKRTHKKSSKRSSSGEYTPDKEIMNIHSQSMTLPFGDPRAKRVTQEPGTECDLYIELEPFYYTSLTRKSTMSIEFSSNCIPRTSLELEVNYGDNKLVNWNYHPTKIYMNLFQNTYEIRLKSNNVIDRNDILKAMQYTRAEVSASNQKNREISLTRRNSIYLPPQILDSFNSFNLKKLEELKGLWECKMIPKRFSDYNGRIKRRKVTIEKMRKKGFTDQEIHGLIKENLFESEGDESTPHSVSYIQALMNEHEELKLAKLKAELEEQAKKNPKPRKLENQNDRNLSKKKKRDKGETGKKGKRGSIEKKDKSKSQLEIEEEKQRKEEGKQIHERLKQNFIYELVIVCAIR